MDEQEFVARFRATALSKGYSHSQIDQIKQSIMIAVRESFLPVLVSLHIDPLNAPHLVSEWYGWSRNRITWEYLFGDDPSLPYPVTEPLRPASYNRMRASFDHLELPVLPLPANAANAASNARSGTATSQASPIPPGQNQPLTPMDKIIDTTFEKTIDATIWESPLGTKIDEDKLMNDYERSKKEFAKNEKQVMNHIAAQSQRIADLETLCENLKLKDVQSQSDLREFERFKAFNAECKKLGSYADFKQVEKLQDAKDTADLILSSYDSDRKSLRAKLSKSEADASLWKNENTVLRAENTALRAEITVLRAEATQQVRQEQSGS